MISVCAIQRKFEAIAKKYTDERTDRQTDRHAGRRTDRQIDQRQYGYSGTHVLIVDIKPSLVFPKSHQPTTLLE